MLMGLIFTILEPGPAYAQNKRDSYLDTRFTIAAHAGYQWGGSVDYQDNSGGIQDGSASIDAGPTIGGQLGLKVAQNAWAIVSYHHQFTSGTSTWYYQGTRSSEEVDLGVGYLQIGGQIEFPVNEHLVPLLGLTLGASYFARSGGDVDNTDWFFAFAFFGGLKIPVVKNFGFLTQLKLLTTVIANDSHAVCVSYKGCVITLDTNAMVQGEISGGIYLAF